VAVRLRGITLGRVERKKGVERVKEWVVTELENGLGRWPT